MTDNEKAIELLEHFAEMCAGGVISATWAHAFLQEGGESTWDAIKTVSYGAEELSRVAAEVAQLRDRFDSIIP